MTPTSEWNGWLHFDWKLSQVDQNLAPFAVCPSDVVMTHPAASTTQWPAVKTAVALTSVPLHDPIDAPVGSRRSIVTLAGLLAPEPDEPGVEGPPHAAAPPTSTRVPR